MFDKLKKAGERIVDGVTDAVDELKDNNCDWRLDDDVHHASCGDSLKYTLISSDLIYCPFCGKKIDREEGED